MLVSMAMKYEVIHFSKYNDGYIFYYTDTVSSLLKNDESDKIILSLLILIAILVES